MSRRPILLIAVALVAWLVGMVATLPATRALGVIAPNVEAAGVHGTFWSGGARRMSFGGPAPATAVQWDLSAWRLLTGQIAGRVSFDFAGLDARAHFARSLDGAVAVDEAIARGPGGSLASLVLDPAVAAAGDLLARVDEALVGADGRPRRVQARFQWSDARLTAPIRLSLGTVRGRLAPVQGSPDHRLELSGSDGQLAIEGDIRLEPDGRYHTDVLLTPAANAPPGLADTLALFARREGNAFRIRGSGRLALP